MPENEENKDRATIKLDPLVKRRLHVYAKVKLKPAGTVADELLTIIMDRLGVPTTEDIDRMMKKPGDLLDDLRPAQQRRAK